MTLTWVIPPLEPVLPSSWVTLAFTGSESMVIIKLIFILFLRYYFKGQGDKKDITVTLVKLIATFPPYLVLARVYKDGI